MKFASDILLTGAPLDMFGVPGEDTSGLTLSYRKREEGEILYLDITMTRKEAVTPPPFCLYFEIPTVDFYSTWSPAGGANTVNLRPNWSPNTTPSSLASWLPVQALLSADGENRMTVALSDAYVPTEISTGIREETGTTVTKITFFTGPASVRSEYRVTVRLDFRALPFYRTVADVSEWWETDCGYTPAYVPEAAREPIDSLWYSFHQDLNPEEMLKECRASRPFGLKTCIIDDGWQTDDSSRGYAYCGDWELATGKIPDMKAFCDALHQMDMKLVLWYSVPFVGRYSGAFERFRGMYLDEGNRMKDVFVLDPRYKEVRDYLIGIYAKAQKDWGLDGFKLDFIDAFRLGEKETPDPRRDYTSLEEAVDALMTGVTEALTAVNPDVLIEFRQSYIGPAIRKFGNMLRVGDCPNDPISNRTGVLNMRLTSGHTAVHSDMLMWSPEDTVESAAYALTSVLFSVPQISVRLEEYPENHKKMLKTYLDFWYAHQSTLLDGELELHNPESRYSEARATRNGEEVLVSYTARLLTVKARRSEVINATSSDTLVIKGAAGKNYVTRDCMGNLLSEGKVEEDLAEIPVPVCGFLTLK